MAMSAYEWLQRWEAGCKAGIGGTVLEYYRRQHMDEKVDTAAELEAAKQKLADAEKAHAEAVAAASENRSPDELLTDFMDLVTMRLGNRPEMRAIVAQLKKHSAPAPAGDKEAA